MLPHGLIFTVSIMVRLVKQCRNNILYYQVCIIFRYFSSVNAIFKSCHRTRNRIMINPWGQSKQLLSSFFLNCDTHNTPAYMLFSHARIDLIPTKDITS